jgi:eukaryotic-like serine/threonine-protein kinase
VIGKTLDHYTVIAEVGRGGMGEVYRAHDTRLDRDVAVKVLPADVASDPERQQRFMREARAVAALSHPNIIAIHDFGVQDGIAYAVMELLEGRTLADEIRLHAPLPVEAVIRHAERIASGLAAAHARGLLHRDLKPQNVFLTQDGGLKILDFGLAKSVGAEGDARTEAEWLAVAATVQETSPHEFLGTVSYTAPERFAGKACDQRADLFALGIIVWEMLTGRNPFVRPAAMATVSAILTEEPADPPAATGTLAALVRECLKKAPAERIGSAAEVAARLAACRAMAAPAPATAVMTASAAGPAGAPAAIDSLAVLPFHNEADDEEIDYLIDGLTDALIDNLSQLPQLKVMARSTVFRCRGQDYSPGEVGAALGVRAVLSGRLQRRGGALVIRAELVDATDGTRLWGGRFDRPLGDLLPIEDELCAEITQKLRLRLSHEEQGRIAKRHTDSPAAHEAYLKGRFVWNRWKTPEAMRTAIGFFERAIELDPLYARAFAGLADSYSILGNIKALPPNEAYPRARTAAEQGLAIDDGLAELHTSLGFIQRFWEWDWEASRRSFERALSLNSGYSSAHRFYSHLLAGLGEHAASIESAKRALELDPLSPIIHTAVGDVYFYARRYDEAMEYYRKSLELDPGLLAGHTDLARALERAGRYEEAIAAFRTAESLAPKGPPEPSSGLAHVHASMGRRAEALAIVAALQALSATRYVSPYGIGSIYACLGETDTALDWLERAYAEHDQTLVWVKVHPRLDTLRGEARYRALLEKMRL